MMLEAILCYHILFSYVGCVCLSLVATTITDNITTLPNSFLTPFPDACPNMAGGSRRHDLVISLNAFQQQSIDFQSQETTPPRVSLLASYPRQTTPNQPTCRQMRQSAAVGECLGVRNLQGYARGEGIMLESFIYLYLDPWRVPRGRMKEARSLHRLRLASKCDQILDLSHYHRKADDR